MASRSSSGSLRVFIGLLLVICCSSWLVSGDASDLSYDYYKSKCPDVEEIVKKEVERIYYIHGNAATSFLRNIFHDCAVQGCDGSLLLRSLPNHPGEQDSDKNFGLRNMKYIQVIKEAVEKECPGVVSCADIVILSGRDGVGMLGGPYFPVKTGRRDTRTFSVEAADSYLVAHDADVTTFLSRMADFNLNTAQAVALLGAHSVGRVHCKNLVERLYPSVDPTLNATYAEYLKKRCPSPHPDPRAVAYSRNDPATPMKLDNHYYENLVQLKGLLPLDDAIYLDARTRPCVLRMASDNHYFFDQFVEAMSILTEYKPLTGDDQGEIRRRCAFVN